MANITKRPEKALAIQIFATQPGKSIQQVAVEVGVDPRTMYNWRSDPKFMDAIYERYMVDFGGELPAVLGAMVREAKAGNVQAGRLVLEHSGKLVKNVNVTIDSPFEKWLKKVDDAEVIDGEIIEDDVIDLVEEIQVEIEDLPPRNTEDYKVRVKREQKSLAKEKKKAKKELEIVVANLSARLMVLQTQVASYNKLLSMYVKFKGDSITFQEFLKKELKEAEDAKVGKIKDKKD